MKKPKTLEVKLRSAIRLIWSRSAERRAVIKAAMKKGDASSAGIGKYDYFTCGICGRDWAAPFAEVDHIEPVGALDLAHVTEFVQKMFFSPQQVVDKMCHKSKTAQQRKKAKK